MVVEPSLSHPQQLLSCIPTKDPHPTLPPSAYTGQQAGPYFYMSDNHARDLLSHMDLPLTPKNLKALIHCFDNLEEAYEGKGKKWHITPECAITPDSTDLEISFGLEPTLTNEQIWSEADAALMNIDDGMGPLDNGGFNERYLHSFSSPLTHVKLPTVHSSSCPLECFFRVFTSSIPKHVLFPSNKQECDCDETENIEQVEAWLLDSCASMHFTLNLSDFSSFEELKPEKIQTTAKNHVLEVTGKGTVYRTHDQRSRESQVW